MYRLLNSEEAGVCLNLPSTGVEWLAKTGFLPHCVLPDGDVRFRFADLRAYAEAAVLQMA